MTILFDRLMSHEDVIYSYDLIQADVGHSNKIHGITFDMISNFAMYIVLTIQGEPRTRRVIVILIQRMTTLDRVIGSLTAVAQIIIQ